MENGKVEGQADGLASILNELIPVVSKHALSLLGLWTIWKYMRDMSDYGILVILGKSDYGELSLLAKAITETEHPATAQPVDGRREPEDTSDE